MTRRLRAPGTLVGALRDVAETRGHKVAFRVGAQALTFGDLWRAARRAADALTDGGVRPGQVVGVGCRDPLTRIVAHCGVLLAGACALPLNPDYRDELATILPVAEATALVADRDLATRAVAAVAGSGFQVQRIWTTGAGDDVPDTPLPVEDWQAARQRAPHAPERGVSPDDPALLCFTSGTTGAPKGVLHTHARCMLNLAALRSVWEWGAADVLYLPVVLFHVHGLQNGVHGTLATGCTTVLPDGPLDGATMLDTIAAERCSLVFGVPTHYERLLTAAAHPDAPTAEATQGLRLCVSGSAPLGAELFRRFQERFGHAICERYGMTETLMITANGLQGDRRAGAVGQSLPGTAVQVTDPETGQPCAPGDVGEVWVRGTCVFDGYHARPGFAHPATADAFRDGWFRTGDRGAWGSDGVLELAGRSDDLILTGGMNVCPREVEDALCSHPGVAAVGVVGVPDGELGHCVAAGVVARPGAALEPATLARHVGGRLAGFKKPRRILLLDALPQNAVGKLDRLALAALLADVPPVPSPAPEA